MKAFFQKLGWYITFLFLGGLITLYMVAKYIGFDNTKIEIKIDKMKNKRTSGPIDTTIPIKVESPRNRKKKRQRKEKRDGSEQP
jgi:hypothetical protein